MKIIIEINDGEYTVQGDRDVEPIILDWSREDWDFDFTEQNIRELLDSNLDGPEIFRLIKRCIKKFEEWNGEA
jgi:hypothetical protein